MANLGRALMSGLVAGFGQYAGMKMDEKQKAEQAERDRKLAELQDKLMRQKAQFEASLKGDTFNTFEDTDAQGNTVKRTLRSGYDPEKGKYSEEVGSAVQTPKDTRSAFEREAEFFKNDPSTYTAMKRAGQRPLMPSAGGESDKVTAADYAAMTPEARAMYDRYKGRAEHTDEDARLKRIAVSQLNTRMRDFDKKEARDRKADYASFGIDPNSSDARKQLRDAMQSEIFGSFGLEMPVEETVEVIEAGPGNQPPTKPPGSSKSNPAPAESFSSKPPSGTWVKLPNGQVIQVP